MPYGCGEQNMVTFVPNIVALRYLECTGQGNPELGKNAIRFMEAGYHINTRMDLIVPLDEELEVCGKFNILKILRE